MAYRLSTTGRGHSLAHRLTAGTFAEREFASDEFYEIFIPTVRYGP